MKRLLTIALGLAALASCNGVKWTLTETEYGYNVMTQKRGQTIAYSPESGVAILTVDGYAFKDLNRNGELDVYEDWRLGAEQRAEDLAAQLTIEEIAGMMLYSSHQSVPSRGGMFGGAMYDGKPYGESGAAASDLSDAQKKFLTEDNLRAVLVTTVESPAVAAQWNNNMQALVEGMGHGVPVNTSSDPRHETSATAEYNYGAGGEISHWPTSLGLAATFDPALVEEFGRIASEEYRALGIATALSPQIDLATEPRWTRFYGTFGESPVEIYGPESSGKTTLAIHAIAQAQKQGGIAAIIDAEHAFDRTYAKNLGVDLETLLISQPDNGEQALEIADNLIRSGAIDIIVIDSVAALTPKAEIEGEMGDSKMGLQARLMSQALRKLTANISKTNTCCIFINQLRDKIGVMFGNPETTTGGNALKFYASVRVDVRRTTQIKDGDEALGNRTKVKIVKNKMAPPFKKAEFDIVYGEGISKIGEIIDLGVEYEIIKKSGSWFSYGESKLAQGREAVKQLLSDNTELCEEIEAKIREALQNVQE